MGIFCSFPEYTSIILSCPYLVSALRSAHIPFRDALANFFDNSNLSRVSSVSILQLYFLSNLT